MIKVEEINYEKGSWTYLKWDHNSVGACIITSFEISGSGIRH